jgi:hypothetical protein
VIERDLLDVGVADAAAAEHLQHGAVVVVEAVQEPRGVERGDAVTGDHHSLGG